MFEMEEEEICMFGYIFHLLDMPYLSHMFHVFCTGLVERRETSGFYREVFHLSSLFSHGASLHELCDDLERVLSLYHYGLELFC